MSTKHICWPFAREAPYQHYVENPGQYRQYLRQMLAQHPELFPTALAHGCTFHDGYASVKQDLLMRRITLKATGDLYSLRPSLVRPYMIAHTAEVEKALSWRQWGVPFEALNGFQYHDN